MYVDTVRLDGEVRGYAAGLPLVRRLAAGPFRLTSAVTILTGENGSGKSTFVESVAAEKRANPSGGSRNARFTAAGDAVAALPLRIGRSENPRDVFFLRGESFFDLAQYHASLPGDPLAGVRERSHGEGIMDVITRHAGPGTLLLLDEPEDGLSIFTQLELLGLLTVLARRGGSQIIMATHSPVLLAVPGAQIVDASLKPVLFDATEAVTATREFIADPLGTARFLVAP